MGTAEAMQMMNSNAAIAIAVAAVAVGAIFAAATGKIRGERMRKNEHISYIGTNDSK